MASTLLRNASPAELLAAKPKAVRDAFIDQFTGDELRKLQALWRGWWARPDQLAPSDDVWNIWLILAGRGFGKTRTGAEWVCEEVETAREALNIALIAETQKDLEEVMIEGPSGILTIAPPGLIQDYRRKPVRIRFTNGSQALGYNATAPDQLRGPQFHRSWGDEIAKWRYLRETFDQLQYGMRLGKPRQVFTSTPRNVPLIRELVARASHDGEVRVTRGSTAENLSNLSSLFIKSIYERYEGTRLGRQELNAEILEDIANGLWVRRTLDEHRVNPHLDGHVKPELGYTNVAVDPAVTGGEEADEHGITVQGMLKDEARALVVADRTTRGSPDKWARAAVAAYDEFDADCIVAEVNQGGDMVAALIKSVRPEIIVRPVRATKGKHVRAEPIAALYEQGRVSHLGTFAELEDQMCLMTTGGFEGEGSPDRVDALVWGMTDLFERVVEKKRPAPVDLYGGGSIGGSGSWLGG